MQDTILVADGVMLRAGHLRFPGYRQELTEAQQQPQCIRLGEITGGFIPLRYEFRTVVGGPERGLQFSEGFIVETEVCGDEPFFKDSRASKHRHRGALRLIRRNQQHFPVSLEKSSGDA